MRKSYKLQDLECANCAAKMQDGIAKLDTVNSVSVNFMMQKMVIDTSADDLDGLLDQVQSIISKIEPDCVIVR